MLAIARIWQARRIGPARAQHQQDHAAIRHQESVAQRGQMRLLQRTPHHRRRQMRCHETWLGHGAGNLAAALHKSQQR